MKKIIILAMMLFCTLGAYANEDVLSKEQSIQTRIDNIGVNLLNSNKITKRIVFVYDKKEKKKNLTTDKTLTKRQVIIYDGLYQTIQSDDELAAMLSREIATAHKSFDGMWGGGLDSIQIALGSKKFETYADKRAVDYMVKAGYNPLALIIHIHKVYPQKKYDKFSRHNLTSKRLARIYEYITYKYPQYLQNNEYIQNPHYQNFLLTSLENRKMLERKILSKSKTELKYE